MAMTRLRREWYAWTILFALGSIFLAGCGKEVKRIPVAGTVTLDGKPLDGVVLAFSPDTTKGNTAQINCSGPVKEGRYELQTAGITGSASSSGVPPGWYKVTVRIPNIRAKRQSPAQVDIPDKYLSVAKTPLEVEVKDNPEPGAYDIKLSK